MQAFPPSTPQAQIMAALFGTPNTPILTNNPHPQPETLTFTALKSHLRARNIPLPRSATTERLRDLYRDEVYNTRFVGGGGELVFSGQAGAGAAAAAGVEGTASAEDEAVQEEGRGEVKAEAHRLMDQYDVEPDNNKNNKRWTWISVTGAALMLIIVAYLLIRVLLWQVWQPEPFEL